MKEADKRARITVAYGGLVLLQQRFEEDPNYRSTRLKLFAIPSGQPPDNSIIKAARSKDWQKEYIKRMVDGGMLIKVTEDSQELYYPSSPRCIAELLEDHDNYGLRLSKFLFPSEAGMPKELIESEEKDAEPEESEPSSTLSPADADLAAKMASLIVATHSKLDAIIAAHKLENRWDQEVSEALNSLNARLPEAPTQASQEFPSYVRNQFKEIDSRLAKIEESFAFSSRTLARMDAGIDALTKTVGSLRTVLIDAVADGVPVVLQHLRTMIGIGGQQTLTGVLEARFKALEGKSLLRDTLTELRLKISDLRAIEDLALKAISAEEGEVNNGS